MFAYAKAEQKQNSKSAIQKKEPEKTLSAPNQIGIPDYMKARFENLSGFSFDDVRVHYNSNKPAQLQTPGYTQGSVLSQAKSVSNSSSSAVIQRVIDGKGVLIDLKSEKAISVLTNVLKVSTCKLIGKFDNDEINQILNQEVTEAYSALKKYFGGAFSEEELQDCSEEIEAAMLEVRMTLPQSQLNAWITPGMQVNYQLNLPDRYGFPVDLNSVTSMRVLRQTYKQYPNRSRAAQEVYSALYTEYGSATSSGRGEDLKKIKAVIDALDGAETPASLSDGSMPSSELASSTKISAKFDEDGAPIKTHHDLNIEYGNPKIRRFVVDCPKVKGKVMELRDGTGHRLGSDGMPGFHEHITGGDAIEFRWRGDKTIIITAYGTKSDSAPMGSGGYKWNSKP
jgi:hypothetical protein